MAPCTAMTTGSSESLSLLDTVIVQYILTLCKLQHLDSGNDSSLHIQGIHGYLFSSWRKLRTKTSSIMLSKASIWFILSTPKYSHSFPSLLTEKGSADVNSRGWAKWPKHGLEHQLRETIKRRTTEMKVEIQLSMSSENENGIWNSAFQSLRKMKNKNRSLNFVFKCRRKTVGTRVHAFIPHS